MGRFTHNRPTCQQCNNVKSDKNVADVKLVGTTHTQCPTKLFGVPCRLHKIMGHLPSLSLPSFHTHAHLYSGVCRLACDVAMPAGIRLFLAELRVQLCHIFRMNLQLLYAKLRITRRANCRQIDNVAHIFTYYGVCKIYNLAVFT